MLPIPSNPQWPDKNLPNPSPIIQKQAQVDLGKGLLGRILDWLFNKPLFMVMEDFYIYVPCLVKWVFIPKNFVFDFASVPKALWFLFSPTGILAIGSLPHDFGFRFGGLMVSAGPEDPYKFVVMGQRAIDKVLESLTDKDANLPLVSKLVSWSLRIFAKWKPIPMDDIDWSMPVMTRKFYSKRGILYNKRLSKPEDWGNP